MYCKILRMTYQPPTISEYKQWIRALRAKREALDKEIAGLETAMEAQETVETSQKKKRNRPKTEETKTLETWVQNVFRDRGVPTLKLIDAIRETLRQYPEGSRPTESDMRGKFHNLKKSKFIMSVDEPYGHIKLAKPLTQRNMQTDVQ